MGLIHTKEFEPPMNIDDTDSLLNYVSVHKCEGVLVFSARVNGEKRNIGILHCISWERFITKKIKLIDLIYEFTMTQPPDTTPDEAEENGFIIGWVINQMSDTDSDF